MTRIGARNIVDGRFRASPALELVVFDRLPADVQQQLAALVDDPELYGILKPKRGDAGAKTVSKEIALLFLTTRTPGPLPNYLRAAMGSGLNNFVAKLVLDGILEIDHDGRFLSGPAAMAVVSADDVVVEGSHPLTRLSQQALAYGQALALEDALALADRLYNYNSWPASARWRKQLATPADVAKYLDIQATVKATASGRFRLRRARGQYPWFNWTRATAQGKAAYKLYLSPKPDGSAETLRVVCELASQTAALAFKVGANAHGLLRPDKLVMYFAEYEHLKSAAELLAPRLRGTEAQGVPFTAPLDERGLLSWGMDPPPSVAVSPWREGSWRLWLCDRLAVALIAAKRRPHGRVAPWRFALARIRLEGIDTSDWSPRAVAWRAS